MAEGREEAAERRPRGEEPTDPERPSARPEPGAELRTTLGPVDPTALAQPGSAPRPAVVKVSAPGSPLSTAPSGSATPFEDRLTRRRYRDAREMVDDYLRRFADAVNVDAPRLDGEGYAELEYGSIVVGVNVLEEHGVLLLLSRMRAVPAEGKERFFRRLLELNFLVTSDAAFAIDAEADAVYLRVHRRLAGLDFEELADALVSIARVADEWDLRLAELFPKAR